MNTKQSSRIAQYRGLQFQITSAFMSISLLLGVLLVSALWGMNQMQAKTQHIVNTIAERSRTAENLAVLTLQCRRYEKDMWLNLNDSTARNEYLLLWKDAYQQLEQELARYATLVDSETQQQVTEWQTNARMYQQAVLDVEAAIERGEVKTPQAANAALTPAKGTIRTLTESAQLQSDNEHAALIQANETLIAQGNRMLLVLSISGMTALLLAIGASVIFPKRLLRPITTLQKATHALAQGNFAVQATVTEHNELGMLAAHFNNMAAQIHRQMRELDQSALIQQQNNQLRELLTLVQDLETPAIRLMDQVLLVPIVGNLDERRAKTLQSKVLAAVHAQRAQTVIIDLTGLTILDSQAAYAIDSLLQSIRLLGATTMLTGINSMVALTAIKLNLQLDQSQVVAHVQDAIQLAMAQQQRNAVLHP